MIQALHHIGLSVGDLAQSSAFLHRAFAFDRTALTMPSPAPTLAPQHHIAQCQLLLTPNCYLELQTFAPAQPQPNRWRPVNEAGISHFCVQHQQMARLYDDCAAAGAQFHSAPVDLGTGWRYCYARDPEGNVIELEASPLAPLGQSPWAAHVAIVTPNIERLATFYHQLLGGARVGGRKIGPNPNLDLIAALPKVEVILTWL
ncbi:MAG: VOC family protein, partial [Chloroflexota bacterium]